MTSIRNVRLLHDCRIAVLPLEAAIAHSVATAMEAVNSEREHLLEQLFHLGGRVKGTALALFSPPRIAIDASESRGSTETLLFSASSSIVNTSVCVVGRAPADRRIWPLESVTTPMSIAGAPAGNSVFVRVLDATDQREPLDLACRIDLTTSGTRAQTDDGVFGICGRVVAGLDRGSDLDHVLLGRHGTNRDTRRPCCESPASPSEECP